MYRIKQDTYGNYTMQRKKRGFWWTIKDPDTKAPFVFVTFEHAWAYTAGMLEEETDHGPMTIRLIVLYAIVAHIADAYLTARGVGLCGLQCEMAPVAHAFMEAYGVNHGLLLLKLIGLPPALYAWLWPHHKNAKIISVALALSGTIGYCSWLFLPYI